MKDKLRLLFFGLILIVVFSSLVAIKLQSSATSAYVLGAKTEQQEGSFTKFLKKFLKLIGLRRDSQKEEIRTFEYVNPDKLQESQPPTITGSGSPSPASSPNAVSSPLDSRNLPPPPPPPGKGTLGAKAKKSSQESVSQTIASFLKDISTTIFGD